MKKRIFMSLMTFGLFVGLSAIVAIGANFTLQESDGNNPLQAEAAAYPVLVGSMNSWNASNMDYPMTLKSGTEDVYSWTGVLAVDVEFKVNVDGNSSNFKGITDHNDSGCKFDGVFIDPDSGGASTNIKVTTSYKFVIEYNTTTLKIDSYLYQVQAATTGITSNLMRVWVDRGVYEADNALVSIQYGTTISDSSDIVTPTGWVERSNTYYYAYYDIPTLTAGQKLRVVRLSEKRGKFWNVTSDFSWTIGANNKVFFVGDDYASLTNAVIPDNTSTNAGTLLLKVLEGYLTCSDSAVNGAGAFKQMNLSFFKKADETTWRVTGQMGDYDVADYSYASGYDYSTARGTGITVDSFEKYTALETRYNALPQETITDRKVIIDEISFESIMILTGVSLAFVAGYFLLKKRLSIA